MTSPGERKMVVLTHFGFSKHVQNTPGTGKQASGEGYKQHVIMNMNRHRFGSWWQSSRLWVRVCWMCAVTFCVLILIRGPTVDEVVDPTLSDSTLRDPTLKDSRFVMKNSTLPQTINLEQMDQKDANLIKYIRNHHVIEPSTLEYSFGNAKELQYLEPPLDSKLYALFKNQTTGFFVEIGGADGLESHTLKLEKDYKWTGLLAECNPPTLQKLKATHRKAYIVDLCISTGTHPAKANITSPDAWRHASTFGVGEYLYVGLSISNRSIYEVQTVPLYAILAAINVFEVDLFILDIQSLELNVLKHFPFDLVLVKVWVVETFFFNKKQKDWLIEHMDKNGYPASRVYRNWRENRDYDIVFFHKSFAPSFK